LNLKNRCRTLGLLCLLALTVQFSIPIKPVSSQPSHRVILLRVDSAIDYKTVDLVDEATKDIMDGKADALLLQIDSGAGYLSPTINIVNKLSSLSITIIAYIGPGGAAASAHGAYLAMASTILAMNVGTTVGMARISSENSTEINSLSNLMRKLATARGRNAEAAGRMAIDNVVYSAEEAYAEGVCDLVVDSYDGLLKKLDIDAAGVVEKTRDQSAYINQDSYSLLKLLADPTTIKYLFFAVTALVCLNLLFAITRPRRTRRDETYEALLHFMRMEMESSMIPGTSGTAGAVHETPLHTSANIPSTPTFNLNRIPTHQPVRRIERPLEVNKR